MREEVAPARKDGSREAVRSTSSAPRASGLAGLIERTVARVWEANVDRFDPVVAGDTATSLGVPVRAMRNALFGVQGLLVGVLVAVAGGIVPAIERWFGVASETRGAGGQKPAAAEAEGRP